MIEERSGGEESEAEGGGGVLDDAELDGGGCVGVFRINWRKFRKSVEVSEWQKMIKRGGQRQKVERNFRTETSSFCF